MSNELHGPGHLFCAGCNMEDDALARAAWAGNQGAKGFHKEAEDWAESAKKSLGRLMSRSGAVDVRFRGNPDVEDIDLAIATLQFNRDSCMRRAERKKKEAAALDDAVVPPT